MGLPTAARLLPYLVLALLAVGCSAGDGRDRARDNATPDTGTSVPPSTASPSPSTTTPPSPTTPPSEALEKIRIVGEVVSTGDCVVVRDDNAITWTITGGGAARLDRGARVRVTGAPDLRAEGCGGPLVRAVTIVVEG